MLINTRAGYVFVHVPKTGGTSVHKALLALDGSGKTLWGFDENGRDLAHLTLRDMPQAASLRSFCFVRDPLERCYSSFMQTAKARDTEATRHAFGEFIRSGELRRRLPIVHFRPQHEFAHGVETVLAHRREGLVVPGWILGRYEDLLVPGRANERSTAAIFFEDDIRDAVNDVYADDRALWQTASAEVVPAQP